MIHLSLSDTIGVAIFGVLFVWWVCIEAALYFSSKKSNPK